MPLRIACPHCKVQLTVNESLCGKAVRCARCQKAFGIPAGPTPGAAAPAAAAPSPPKRPAPPPRQPDEVAAQSFQDNPGRVVIPRSAAKAPATTAPRRAVDADFEAPIEKKSSAKLWIAVGAGVAAVAAAIVIVLLTIGGGTPDDEPVAKNPDDEAPPVEQVLDIKPPELAADRVEKDLPSEVADVAVGGAGRYLVLHLPKLRKLAIFDINEAKVTNYISAADDQVKFAVGLDKLVLVLGTSRVMQRWDLAKAEKEVTLAFPFPGAIKCLAMGSASRGPVMVQWAVGTGALDNAPLAFLDLQTLKELPIVGDGLGGRSYCYRDNMHFRASAEGNVFGMWCTSHSPQGVGSMILTGNRLKKYYDHDSRGHIVPGPDGKWLYTGSGVITSEVRELARKGALPATLPAVHGNSYLRFPRGDDPFGKGVRLQPSVHLAGDERPLVTLPEMDLGIGDERWAAGDFTFDKRVHYIPQAKVIALIPHTNNKVILHRFDLETALDKAGIDYLFVSSRPPAAVARAKTFSYQMVVRSKKGGVSYKLEAGPGGMAVSPEGKVVWRVPPDFAEPETSVIVTIADKSGQEIFHTFKVGISDVVAVAPKDGLDPWKDKLPRDKFERKDDFGKKDGPPPWFDKGGDDKGGFKDFAKGKDFPFDKDRDFGKDKFFKDKVGLKDFDKDKDFKEKFPIKDKDVWVKDGKDKGPPLAKAPVIPPADPSRVPIKTPALEGDKVTRNLPSTFGDVSAGGGGRFLIFHLPKTRQLAVFDANEAKIVKYLPVAADNVRLAAGLDKLIVVLVDEKIIQRWNLVTFEREVSVPLPLAHNVNSVAMGHASNGPLMLQTGGEPFGGEMALMDILTMKQFDVPELKERRIGGGGRGIQIHASADGKVFGVAAGFDSAVMVFDGGRLKVTRAEAPGGQLIPGPDGKSIFTTGGVFTLEMRKTVDHSFACLPAYHGTFYLGASLGGHPAFPEKSKPNVSVFVVGDSRPLLSMGDLDLGVRSDPFRGDSVPVNKRLHFIPNAKMIVAVPMSNDKLVLHRFDVQEALDKAGIDYLFVDSSPPPFAVRGDTYSYPVGVKTKKGGLNFKLDSGPAGMKASAGGTLSWPVPKDFAEKDADIILSIGDKAGQEIFHTFRVSVVDELPPGFKPLPVVKEDPKDKPKEKDPKDKDPKDKEPIVKDVPPPLKVEPVAQNIVPPKLDKDLTVRELPATMNDAAVGGGGRFLLLGLPSQRKIALFDVNEAKVVHYFSVGGDDFSFSAGMTKLVVLVPSTKIIQRFDLFTREKELTTTLPVSHTTTGVLMGSASQGPVVVFGPQGYDLTCTLLDLKTLKRLDMGKGEGAHFNSAGNLRISADGSVFGTWHSGLSPSGLQAYILQGKEVKRHYDHTSVGHIVPGPDGKYLYTGSGIYTNEVKSVGTEKGYVLPSVHGDFYLRLSLGDRFGPGGAGKKDLALHIVGDNRPLITLPHVMDLGGGDDVRFAFAKFGPDKRVFFIPDAKMFVTLPFVNDKIHVHRFDVDEALDKAGIDYLFVTSRAPQIAPKGDWFLYQLGVKSKKGGLKYRMDAGPAGMKVDPKGLVSWKVPADATTPEDVILTISDAAGQEVFHTFKVAPGIAPAAIKKEEVKLPEKEKEKEKEPVVKEAPPKAPPDNAGALAIVPPKLEADKVTRALPGTLEDIAVGGGGRFVLFGLSRERKIALFDVNEAKVVHYFPVGGDNFLFSAGMTKLVIVVPDTRVIQRWDLLTRERDVTATLDVKFAPGQVLLGSASQGPVLLCSNERFGGHAFVDLKTLKGLKVDGKGGGGPNGFTAGCTRVSADGNVFTSWRRDSSPQGLMSFIVEGTTLRAHYEHKSVGHNVPSADGKYLYTASGIYTSECKPVGGSTPDRPGMHYVVPSVEGNFYMKLAFGGIRTGGGKKDLTLHLAGETRSLASLPHLNELSEEDANIWGRAKLGTDKRFLFIPSADLFLTVPITNDKVHVHRLNVIETMEKAGIDYLFVTSRAPQTVKKGDWFLYQIQAKSRKGGLKYRLDSGPDGMKVDAKGMVSWKAPKEAAGEETVILTISDSTGQEVFHSFKVEAVDGALKGTRLSIPKPEREAGWELSRK